MLGPDSIKMEEHAKQQLVGWLTAPDTAFLLGAGCSKCACKPLIGELTSKVMEQADAELMRRYKALKSDGDRLPTIEDLMNYLVRYNDVLLISQISPEDVTTDMIQEWMNCIKKRIVENIADEWKPSLYHERFLLRLQKNGSPRNIFSLNYDTVLESSLDQIRLSYVDGFRGTNWGWFDVDTFNEQTKAAYRIFKLHGSINWVRDSEGHVRRCTTAANEPVIVYPSEQKYLQTQYGVYETLMGQFRNHLREPRPNNYLVTLGYSFNDDHINEAICDSITARGSYLTVLAFVGPEADLEKQHLRLSRFAERCKSQFNAFIGGGDNGKVIGNSVEIGSQKEILDAELWRFENLVELIAGGAS